MSNSHTIIHFAISFGSYLENHVAGSRLRSQHVFGKTMRY